MAPCEFTHSSTASKNVLGSVGLLLTASGTAFDWLSFKIHSYLLCLTTSHCVEDASFFQLRWWVRRWTKPHLPSLGWQSSLRKRSSMPYTFRTALNWRPSWASSSTPRHSSLSFLIGHTPTCHWRCASHRKTRSATHQNITENSEIKQKPNQPPSYKTQSSRKHEQEDTQSPHSHWHHHHHNHFPWKVVHKDQDTESKASWKNAF